MNWKIVLLGGAVLGMAYLYVRWRTSKPFLRELEDDPDAIEMEIEGDVFQLAFLDGRPVKIGQLQEWLDELRADPEISDEAYMVAAGIVKQIRARLN